MRDHFQRLLPLLLLASALTLAACQTQPASCPILASLDSQAQQDLPEPGPDVAETPPEDLSSLPDEGGTEDLETVGTEVADEDLVQEVLADLESPDDAGTEVFETVGTEVADEDLVEEVEVEPTPTWGTPAINEVNCHGGDWVELVNLSDVDPIPLAGWAISDDPFTPQQTWDIPDEPWIAPGGMILFKRQTPEEIGFTFGLACGKDTLYLLDPEGNTVDSVELPLVTIGNSVGRLPDGTGEWGPTAHTPGQANEPALDLADYFYNPFKVHTIDLGLPESSIESLDAEPRTYVPGTLKVTIDGEEEHPELSVGIRLKGRWGSFRTLDQKAAFKVKIDFADDDLRFLGLKRLTLNNMVQDKSMLHEALSYRIFRAFGIPCPRNGYAWVRVNGEDYGLYNLLETLDEVFLSRFYQETTHLYEGDYGSDVVPGEADEFEVDEGKKSNISDLLALIAAAQAEDEVWMASLQPVADLVEMTRMWLVEQYIGHWDGYAPTINNYYIHSDQDERFTMLPWGTDQTFADKRDFYNGKGHLFARCVAIPECRTLYEEALIGLLPVLDTLDNQLFVEQVAAVIAPYAEADPRKEYTMQQVTNGVNGTLKFLQDRRVQADELVACLTDPEGDLDGDGYRCKMDCDDTDPLTWKGAPEICNDGIDQDCNGTVDDGYDCPDCKELFRGTHRYLVCPVKRPYDEAAPHCAEAGSAMVIINNAAENEWLRQQVANLGVSNPWIGLNDIGTEGLFLWTDGTVPTYTNWNSGEPNNAGNEDCAQLLNTGKWNDLQCATAQSILCEDPCAPDLDEDGDGHSPCDADCDDTDASLSPDAEEICGDGIDQDCSGIPDQSPDCTGNILLPVDPPLPGSSFYIYPQNLNWAAAQAQCQKEGPGADLAWFDSAEELTAFLAAVQATYPGGKAGWIGANDIDDEGTFVWADGSPLTYTNWNGNEPNDWGGNEDCGQTLANGKWNDMPCTYTMAAFCRMPTE